jgi:hypothetical protein
MELLAFPRGGVHLAWFVSPSPVWLQLLLLCR